MQNDQENSGIAYPCPWTYRVIGRDRDGVREAVEAAMNGRECLIYYAKASSGGKYHSWNIDLVVQDEEERNLLFLLFRRLPTVVMVI